MSFWHWLRAWAWRLRTAECWCESPYDEIPPGHSARCRFRDPEYRDGW